jgi:hypothetical protein
MARNGDDGHVEVMVVVVAVVAVVVVGAGLQSTRVLNHAREAPAHDASSKRHAAAAS